jgi:hypothetical protein
MGDIMVVAKDLVAEDCVKVFQDLTWRHGLEGQYQSHWPNLIFTERAVGRLMATAGFITGLAMAEKEALAEKLALSLFSNLMYLAEYGGEEEFAAIRGANTAVEGGPEAVEEFIKESTYGTGTAKRFRVVLGDDATFGGFSIQWYRLVTDAARIRHLSVGQDDPVQSESHLRTVISRSIEARVNVPGSDHGSWVGLDYLASMYGGLLCHGMGQEVFAVDISSDSGPRWSVHT